jgi:CBS domain-containing protein
MNLSKVLSEKNATGKVYTIDSGTTVKAVTKKLCELKIGCLLVVQAGSVPPKFVGIVSERDVIRAISSDKLDINVLKVEDIMTKNMIVANQDDDVEYVMNVMTRHNIRHIPVIVGKTIGGVVSIGDIIGSIKVEKEIEVHWLSDFTGGSQRNDVF